MTYEIVFTAKARSQLEKLDRQAQKRVVSILDRIRIRPRHYASRMVGNPYFRVRAGDYRIIMDIQENKLIVMVLYIGHRKRIYKQQR